MKIWHTILEMVRRHLPQDHGDKKENSHSIELAYAVLMIDLALVDNDFNKKEHAFVKTTLCELFELSLDQVYELMDEAQQIVTVNHDADDFAYHLKNTLHAETREELVAILDNLLSLDDRQDSFELDLRNRYQMLLGVRVT